MKIKRKYYALGLLVVASFWFTNCSKTKKNINAFSFYYWKQDVHFSSLEKEYATQLKTDTLFVHFFDVVMDNALPQPIASVHFSEKPTQPIVPVVFIVNDVLLHQDEEGLKRLAENIAQHTLKLDPNHPSQLKSLQLDCDWTDATKENFFKLCTLIKPQVSKLYSTVRLHQFRYFKERGVPPVDKGIVMCYATESPLTENVENSILDTKLLEKYIKNAHEYPLAVDYALPIYSWGVVTNHLGKKKLINALSHQDFVKDVHFKKLNENEYQCLEACFIKGFYVSKGFVIRIETISPELLAKAQQLVQQYAKTDYRMIYYHLDENFIKNYTLQQLNPKL